MGAIALLEGLRGLETRIRAPRPLRVARPSDERDDTLDRLTRGLNALERCDVMAGLSTLETGRRSIRNALGLLFVAGRELDVSEDDARSIVSRDSLRRMTREWEAEVATYGRDRATDRALRRGRALA